ncbi:DUF6338 family protein [Microbacterium sp. KSW2-21]|uniref:DUF6338 family protein n=1 Tax=Microbacterium algihabitans TaxID=3075992 RepID=A0ABU3S072_9MICO|nr:DUF6338 family protein [Microbacterium sp. KSW2-21]MDU0328522.1 DUF6338 family protein [Microbacterium sp. KSW2-21]
MYVSDVTVPDSLPQALIFIAMLVPGFSFVTVRTWFVGWRTPDHGAGSRLLEALYVSAIFIVVYVGIFVIGVSIAGIWTGDGSLDAARRWVETSWATTPGVVTAVLSMVLLVGLPGLLGALLNWRTKVTTVDSDGVAKTETKPVNRNQPTPRAWDHSAYGADYPRFVRVKTNTGVYVGGWFDASGYISTYPFDRDIFIAHQWHMDPKGKFVRPMKDSLGVWVPITDDCIVEWIAFEPANT